MKQRLLAAMAGLILLLAGCGGEESPPSGTGSDPSAGEVSPSPSVPGKETHPTIDGAVRFVHPDYPEANVVGLKYLDEGHMLAQIWTDEETLTEFVYTLADQSFAALPERMQHLKTLDDGSMFCIQTPEPPGEGEDLPISNTYAIVDGVSLETVRVFQVPEDIAWGREDFDISPSGNKMVFWTMTPRENLYVGNANFQNRTLQFRAEYEGTEDLLKAVGYIPHSPVFIDENTILYRVRHRFLDCLNATIDLTTGKITRYQWYEDMTLYPLETGDFFYMYNQSYEFGLVSAESGEKTVAVSRDPTLVPYISYACTPNGTVAAVATRNDLDGGGYTHVIELYNLNGGSLIASLGAGTGGDQEMIPSGLTFSPDGRVLCFVHYSPEGRFKAYTLQLA